MSFRALAGTAVVCMMVLGASSVAGRDPKISTVEVECGEIVEGEFASSFEGHYYDLTMAPGDSMDFAVVPIGDHLEWAVNIVEPGNNLIFEGRRSCRYSMANNTNISSGVLSSRGRYRISVWNYQCDTKPGRHGVYSLHIGCKLRDGTAIKPGERRTSLPPPPPAPRLTRRQTPVTERSADFEGFPGLDPISFAGLSFPKLGLGIPLEGTIAVEGEPFGYRFDGRGGQVLTLNFAKKSGRLNLALVVMDPNGQAVFLTSLRTTETLSAKLRLPVSGEYTLGVARIEHLPSERPSATSFTVEVTEAP